MASLSSVAAFPVPAICLPVPSCLPSATTNELCTRAWQQQSMIYTAFMAASVVPMLSAYSFVF